MSTNPILLVGGSGVAGRRRARLPRAARLNASLLIGATILTPEVL